MIGREIAVAVKRGWSDPANNFKLAQVIAKAKSNNMPNDVPSSAVSKKRQAMETVLITRQQLMRDMDQAAQQLL